MASRRRSNLTTARGVAGEEDEKDREYLFEDSRVHHHHGDVVKPHFLGRVSTFANRFTPSLIARHVNPTVLVIVAAILVSHVTVGSFVFWYARHGTSFCPSDIVEYINWSGSTALYKGDVSFRFNRISAYDSLVRIHPSSIPKRMQPVPQSYRKTFYYDGQKISQPIARAYRSRGWTQVDEPSQAQWIYTYNTNRGWGTSLLPWQRFNMLPEYQKWNSKGQFAYYYKQFERATGRPPSQYVPDTYMLSESKEDAKDFQKKLDNGGANYPWVLKAGRINQGKGITMMAPNSKELLALPGKALSIIEKVEDGGSGDHVNEDWEDMIVQKYICNEMTWGRRKFDVRMYWLVASLDPLIVLYHDGYVRIGNSDYSEEDFSDTRAHLTTHTFLGAEGKATFDEFDEMLTKFWDRKSGRLGINYGDRSYPWPAKSPVEHVRNQFKDALAEMMEVYQKEAFDVPDGKTITAENAFSFYCADFILDNDLDAWYVVVYGFIDCYGVTRSLPGKFRTSRFTDPDRFSRPILGLLNRRTAAVWTRITILDWRCTVASSTA
jgi:Tubulin-tyrosine ligase family